MSPTSARRDPRALRWHALPLIPLAAVCLALAPQAASFASAEVPAALYADYVPWLHGRRRLPARRRTASLVFAWRAMPRAGAARPRRRRPAVHAAHPARPRQPGAGQLRLRTSPSRSATRSKPGVPFYSVDTYDQTLPFYLKRTVTMVAYKDELGFGISRNRRSSSPTWPASSRPGAPRPTPGR